jgi:hypothetical protein
MPKKRQIRKHSVKAQLQVMELAKAGSSLHLEIYAAREKIGTLVLASGSLFWYGRSRHKRKRIAWESFRRDDGSLSLPVIISLAT